ncbi:2Fe-2S iron-sulfur cluster binding domain-containing protein [Paraburkholderia sp. CNPSo 3155]|uniref:pyridoxamine 5'-phosphate oxidase family protein n=1 Tax=Paraburkholderia atlantica TaxID=2654982 RepID=UPI00128BD754|nr:pyridoxamine 5'-phosphate oxidase family protein [Paraburkholderia atlantica]MPW08260.1 2Fe-2S iron-sulfur cluster binding domain-containing protein [Paraburkholderia atlantica]
MNAPIPFAAGWPGPSTPFHASELEAQALAGYTEVADAAGRRGIRDYMPDQHRQFYAQLPFMIVGGIDADGQPWPTWRVGETGFVASPDNRTLRIAGGELPGDPLAGTWREGALFGGLGIELPTRRRNRVNGVVTSVDSEVVTIRVSQAFGNCAQYIQSRTPERTPRDGTDALSRQRRATRLSDEDRALLERADTFFIATANVSDDAGVARGVDVSHRGGLPGFVRVDDDVTLTTPDFAGNKFLNTIGNLLADPRAGLVFADFEHGDLLYVATEAEVVWDGPELTMFEGAQRLVRFHVREVRRSEGVLPFRWTSAQFARELAPASETWFRLRVAAIEQETARIRSFLLEREDGGALPEFEPGQFLPVRLAVPGHAAPVVRSYTLSGRDGRRRYRISVKRHGAASSWLHDTVVSGDSIEAMAPRGTFTFDASSPRPAVFLSAGIGITPMIAMLEQALGGVGASSRHRLVYFFHGARTESERPFGDFLRRAVARHPELSVHLLNSERGEIAHGRIDVERLKQVLPFDDYDFYLCGPASFMRDLYEGLRALNVADERIRFEAFGPSTVTRTRTKGVAPPVVETAVAAGATVTFRRSDRTVNWSAEQGSVLELAEANGIAAPSSCRAGTCGTCAARVLEGSVVYTAEPVAEPGPGCALLCIAKPVVSVEGGQRSLVIDL